MLNTDYAGERTLAVFIVTFCIVMLIGRVVFLCLVALPLTFVPSLSSLLCLVALHVTFGPCLPALIGRVTCCAAN